MELVSSRNVYLDSTMGVQGNGRDCTVHFPSNAFTVDDGQMMRVTLQSFHQYKQWYNINSTNNTFYTSVDGGTTKNSVSLESKDYENYTDLAAEFATKVAQCFLASYQGTAVASLTVSGTPFPTGNVLPGNTSNRVFSCNLLAKDAGGAAVNLSTISGKSNPTILFHQYTGNADATLFQDTHELLGGKATRSLDAVPVNGMTIAFGNSAGTNDAMSIVGFFPMQRSTIDHVYLRSSLITDNFQNHHFDSANATHDFHLISSDILAKLTVHDEFVSFSDLNSQGSGFFVNLANKQLTNATFRITDDKDRLVPLVGTNESQAVRGNFHFNMVLRFDVLQHIIPKHSFGPTPEPKDAARRQLASSTIHPAEANRHSRRRDTREI